MEKLNVSIEIDGRQCMVGTITGNNYRDAVFTYSQQYIDMPGVLPISVHLPLQEHSFSPDETAIFFEGLLPEGFSRRAVANWAKTDENDYISILSKLGQECLGAIQIFEESSQNEQNYYRLLDYEQVKALAAEGATSSTRLLLETHLSLTGASGKVGLYYDRNTDQWYLPIGNCPSTHIVKQSHVRLNQIVLNEQLCMRTAKHMGIDVPESFILNMKDGEDSDVLFATARYDREFSGNKMSNGLWIPERLHQEDFAQALGIHASQKYENDKQGYLNKMFCLLKDTSSNPIDDQLKLWDRIVFNYLIGNTDCHLKNYSLLYDKKMQKIRLAPAYDIVSTCIYHTTTKNMSCYVGREVDINRINRESFVEAAAEAGLGIRLAMKRFDRLADKFENCLEQAAKELKDEGFKQTEGLAQQILWAGGYRRYQNN